MTTIISIILSRLSGFVPIILQYWKITLIIILILYIAYIHQSNIRFLFGSDTFPALRSDIQTLEESVSAYRASNDALLQTINQRNTEILQWKKVTDKLKSKLQEAQQQVQNIRLQTNKTVDSILTAPAPNSCIETLNYLKQQAGDIKWPQ